MTTSISPARLAATHVLRLQSLDTSTKATEALADAVVAIKCSPADERLARTLVFGVLRHQLTLDYFYGIHLKLPPAKLHPVLVTLLRMAAYQKFFLTKIPDYAIVNESVELAKTVYKLKAPQVGFLNAVIRKIVNADGPPTVPAGNRVGELAVRYSFPKYLAGMLVEKYGTHRAVAIMEAANEEHPLTLRVNPLLTTSEALAGALEAEGFQVHLALLAPGALIVEAHPTGASVVATEAFGQGHFYIQDEASQIVPYIVAPRSGEAILDLCSAPGGKATQLAELSGGQSRITATDQSEQRLERVRENIERLRSPGIAVERYIDVVSGGRQFDAVLVDAPCSGLGTVGGRPEIRYAVSEGTLRRQQNRQMEALQQAASLVLPGGRLIYSTCSVSDLENRDTVSRFLRENPDWEILKSDIRQSHSGQRDEFLVGLQRPDGFYATWPAFPGIDGFEAVVLVRREG